MRILRRSFDHQRLQENSITARLLIFHDRQPFAIRLGVQPDRDRIRSRRQIVRQRQVMNLREDIAGRRLCEVSIKRSCCVTISPLSFSTCVNCDNCGGS